MPKAWRASRFTRWQLYRLATGGSRERLDVRQFYGPLYPHNPTAGKAGQIFIIPNPGFKNLGYDL
jgi:hypothetical protein